MSNDWSNEPQTVDAPNVVSANGAGANAAGANRPSGDGLFDFAKKCARAYCAKYDAWRDYDDALGEALLFLVRNEKWRDRPDLFGRVQGRLVRWYQDRVGLRRKTRSRRADVEIESFEARESTYNPQAAAINYALNDARLQCYRGLLTDMFNGATEEELGKPRKQLAHIYGLFVAVLRDYDLEVAERASENCPEYLKKELEERCPLLA